MRVVGKACLLSFFVLLAGCNQQDETTNSAPAGAEPEVAPPPRELSSIVFRAKYFRTKECLPGANGTLALGLWDAYEVVEVVRGELPLKSIKGPQAPEGLKGGETYLFRWTPSADAREDIGQAREKGFKGIWLLGEHFELVPTQKFEP